MKIGKISPILACSSFFGARLPWKIAMSGDLKCFHFSLSECKFIYIEKFLICVVWDIREERKKEKEKVEARNE